MPTLSKDAHIKMLECIINLIEEGSSCAYPSLVIYSSGGAESGTILFKMNLSTPAFSIDNKNNMAVLNSITSSRAINAGRMDTFEFLNRDLLPVIRGKIVAESTVNEALQKRSAGTPVDLEFDWIVNDDSMCVRKGSMAQITGYTLKLQC